jgi:UDP-N-acetylmuramyl pentapeptide phosphotransferase/UDP-N-acetylglucosamine-1-phosphate transferase
MASALPVIVTSALASFVVAGGLVATAQRHGRFTMDRAGTIQSFHSRPTPRIGGIGIYLALLVAFAAMDDAATRRMLATLLLAGVPALAVGALEDVTHRVGVAARLLATLASGVLACELGGIVLTHIDVPVVDAILTAAPFAIAFTAFALAGIANAFNIIDGLNGLASGTAVIAVLGLAFVAANAGDAPLAFTALVLAAAIAGFWLVNFPWGKIFLGDGGAYFTGLAVAWLAVLLPMRNSSVSPWASLLMCGYPVIEAVYSIVRRSAGGRSPGQPDRAHLHSLVATRLAGRLRGVDPTLQNSAVSLLMWICAAIPAFLGVTFHGRTVWLALSAAFCLLLYHCLYRQVARP